MYRNCKLGEEKTLRVFFFGDSICFGQGVSPWETWVPRLGTAIAEHLGVRSQLTVQNPSINGNTTRMALERMPYDVQSHAPQVLYVQFGMNDCNGWETDRGHPRVSPDAFAANLSEIVDRGRISGATQVILGTNHPTTRTVKLLPYADHTYEDANRAYNAIIRRVARSKNALLADAETAFNDVVREGRFSYDDLVLEDQLHLSRFGHDVYLTNRLPILLQAVGLVVSAM